MDKITISGLDIFAYHGVNPEEKRYGQHFLLDITLEADLSRARHSDNLADTVNYASGPESLPAPEKAPGSHERQIRFCGGGNHRNPPGRRNAP